MRVSHTDRHRHSHIAKGAEVSHDIMKVAVQSVICIDSGAEWDAGMQGLGLWRKLT